VISPTTPWPGADWSRGRTRHRRRAGAARRGQRRPLPLSGAVARWPARCSVAMTRSPPSFGERPERLRVPHRRRSGCPGQRQPWEGAHQGDSGSPRTAVPRWRVRRANRSPSQKRPLLRPRPAAPRATSPAQHGRTTPRMSPVFLCSASRASPGSPAVDQPSVAWPGSQLVSVLSVAGYATAGHQARRHRPSRDDALGGHGECPCRRRLKTDPLATRGFQGRQGVHFHPPLTVPSGSWNDAAAEAADSSPATMDVRLAGPVQSLPRH
jgi:hypothetical protein